MKLRLLPIFIATAFALLEAPLPAADARKPLKVLLVTGGCCHDYATQKDILKAGLEARANVVVEHAHSDDKSTKPPIPIYGNPDYAKGYDLVIHDECSAGVNDPAIIDAVLKPHRDGIPGLNLHCAMHSYRIGNPSEPAEPGSERSAWFDFLGLQSSRHWQQDPIQITYTSAVPGITKGLSDWTTIKEELYNNVQVYPGIQVVAHGRQRVKEKKKADGAEQTVERDENLVVAWTNLYQGKTRVFSTTIGHNNETVADGRYLDLLTRGLLWATDKLNDDGTPKPGYGPAGK